MKTKALRLYGKNDVRVESFSLPEPGEDEILARIVSDSLCMSTYKAVIQGTDHKRVPEDVADRPVILGHECCGEIVEVGSSLRDLWKPGDRFILQPALGIPDYPYAPGYSFPQIGGDATYVIVPSLVIRQGCLIPYSGEAFFSGSLCEPISCILAALHEFYHLTPGIHEHRLGIKEDGAMAIFAGCGPMGLGAIDSVLHGDKIPSLLVVTDINDERMAFAERIFAKQAGRTALHFVNTAADGAEDTLRALNGGKNYDDILVMAPVKPLVSLADALLAFDGCLSFFAGPTDPQFRCELNFYNLHYSATHICATFGGGVEDMKEAGRLISEGRINPAVMVTHVGGLDCAAEATLHLPTIPGGKKLIYTGIDLPLTAIADFEKLGRDDPLFAELARIVAEHDGLWCAEAEKVLLKGSAIKKS